MNTTATARTLSLDKGPRETSVLPLDFSDWLIDQGTTIKQWSSQVIPNRAGGLKVASITKIGDALELMLTGGVLGEAYTISLDVIGTNDASTSIDVTVRVRGTSEDQIAGSNGVVLVRPLISVPNVTVAESAGYALAAVTLSVAAIDDLHLVATASPITATLTDFTLPVQWSLNAATWSAGPDVLVPQGTTTFYLRVQIINDTLPEGAETVTLTVEVVDGSAQNSATSGVITIVDDDNLPTLSIASVAVGEGETAAFSVSLSAAQEQVVTVAYTTRAGSASPADFSPTSGALTFQPGVTQQIISVPTLIDGLAENPEAFFVDLSAPVNARITEGTATAVIALNRPPANTSGMNLRFADLGGGSYFLSV